MCVTVVSLFVWLSRCPLWSSSVASETSRCITYKRYYIYVNCYPVISQAKVLALSLKYGKLPQSEDRRGSLPPSESWELTSNSGATTISMWLSLQRSSPGNHMSAVVLTLSYDSLLSATRPQSLSVPVSWRWTWKSLG